MKQSTDETQTNGRKTEAAVANSVQRLVICVRSRDGWCELRDQHNTTYRDMMETKCGSIVTLPWGITRREPNCKECRKAHKDVTNGRKKRPFGAGGEG